VSVFFENAWRDLRRSVIGRRVSPPADAADRLERAFPGEDAHEIPVYEYAAFLYWFEIIARRKIAALTLWGRVFLRGSAERYWRDTPLLLEECFHVLRQWRPGILTVRAYLAESARHAIAGRDAYSDNRFEREAKAFVTAAKSR